MFIMFEIFHFACDGKNFSLAFLLNNHNLSMHCMVFLFFCMV
jgi:hypothetical protein